MHVSFAIQLISEDNDDASRKKKTWDINTVWYNVNWRWLFVMKCKVLKLMHYFYIPQTKTQSQGKK